MMRSNIHNETNFQSDHVHRFGHSQVRGTGATPVPRTGSVGTLTGQNDDQSLQNHACFSWVFAHVSIIFPTLLIVSIFLSGCSTSSTVKRSGKNTQGIYFTENQSIDSELRRDFDKAIDFLKKEKYVEAIDILNRIAPKTPKNSAPYINLGIAYFRTNEFEKAEQSFKKALEINPDHPAAINEFAIFYREVGKFTEARKLYERVVAKYPKFMPARKNFGILCDLYLNDIPCALEQYEAYIQTNPDDEKVKIWIATLRQKKI
ncbi:MAG: tetratricopeptide repeat protein [Exilibacterium sp.]